MLVFPEARLALLAVPKTGTTALAVAFGSEAGMVLRHPPALKHLGVRDFDRHLRPLLERSAGGGRFETVAVMREPIAWLGSWYRYRLREDIAGLAQSTRGLSFDRFVLDHLSDPCPVHAAVGRQSRLIAPAAACRVDHLFRHDRMDALLAFLADRTGVRAILPRRNVSPDAPLDLSAATEARLRADLAPDFALYASLG